MGETEGQSMASGKGRSVSSERHHRRRRLQRAGADAGGPFGIFWISGIAVVGTFVVVILVYGLLLVG